jgi:hypothetical protein
MLTAKRASNVPVSSAIRRSIGRSHAHFDADFLTTPIL